MSVKQALPEDHPKLKKWNRYKDTEEFKNARKWAKFDEHLDGSLWAAFDEGFESGVDIDRQRTADVSEEQTRIGYDTYSCGCKHPGGTTDRTFEVPCPNCFAQIPGEDRV